MVCSVFTHLSQVDLYSIDLFLHFMIHNCVWSHVVEIIFNLDARFQSWSKGISHDNFTICFPEYVCFLLRIKGCKCFLNISLFEYVCTAYWFSTVVMLSRVVFLNPVNGVKEEGLVSYPIVMCQNPLAINRISMISN